MRPPKAVISVAIVMVALAAPGLRAQNPAPAPVEAAPNPMAASRSARSLLRNGQDFLELGQHDRALELLREAESRQTELMPAEQTLLKQAIQRTRQAMRAPEGTTGVPHPTARASSGRRAGAIAIAPRPRPPIPVSVPEEPRRLANVPPTTTDQAVTRTAAPPPTPVSAPAPPELTLTAVPAAPDPTPTSPAPPTVKADFAPTVAPGPQILGAESVDPLAPETLTVPAPVEPPALSEPPAAPPEVLPELPSTRPEPVEAPPVAPEPARPGPAAEPVPPMAAPVDLPELPPARVAPPEATLRPTPVEGPTATSPPELPDGLPVLPAPRPSPAQTAPSPAPAEDLSPADEPAGPPPVMTESPPALAIRPDNVASPVPVPTSDEPPPPAAEELIAPAPAPAPVADSQPEPVAPVPAAPVTARESVTTPARAANQPDPRTSRIVLPPNVEREVEEIANRYQEEMRRDMAPAQPGGSLAGPSASMGDTSQTETRIELPRPPSPTEPRPIRAIPVPEEFVPLTPRQWAPMRKVWVAAATCHSPLYFQDPVLERYGQGVEQALGPHWGRYTSFPLDDPTQSVQRQQILQPFWSMAKFGTQIAMLPYNVVMNPPWEAEYDLGYYRPGDKVPPDTLYWPLHGFGPPLSGKNY